MENTELEAIVDLGMEFFINNAPEVLLGANLEKLVMSSFTRCLLGQHFGSFEIGMKELKLTIDQVVEYGLDRNTKCPYRISQLTPIWQQKIKAWKEVIECPQN